jgi:F-type H+-transporting ATPase subunit delta
MDVGPISMRYARALLGFAIDNKSEDAVYEEMSCLMQVYFKTPEIKFVFDNPLITAEERQRVLIIAAGGKNISKTTKEFINFVIKKEKEFFMFFIAMAYQDLYKKLKKIVSVEIISAQALNETIRKKIVAVVEKNYPGCTTLVNLTINPEIIGGFIVEIDNTRLDASVQGELKAIKKDLKIGIEGRYF